MTTDSESVVLFVRKCWPICNYRKIGAEGGSRPRCQNGPGFRIVCGALISVCISVVKTPRVNAHDRDTEDSLRHREGCKFGHYRIVCVELGNYTRLNSYWRAVESRCPAETINCQIVREVVDTRSGVPLRNFHLNPLAIMSPAVGDTDDAGHHLFGYFDWYFYRSGSRSHDYVLT